MKKNAPTGNLGQWAGQSGRILTSWEHLVHMDGLPYKMASRSEALKPVCQVLHKRTIRGGSDQKESIPLPVPPVLENSQAN
jgi:hypothetical protein